MSLSSSSARMSPEQMGALSTQMESGMACCLHIDKPQVLDTTQQRQGRANLGLPTRIENYNGATNASGLWAVTFTEPFTTTPSVQPVLIGADTETSFQVVSRTTTGFVVKVFRRNKIALLGADILSFGSSILAGALVDVRVEGS